MKTQLEEIQDKLALAIQADMEQGVAWLTDWHTTKFKKEYPNLSEFFEWLYELDEVDNGQNTDFPES